MRASEPILVAADTPYDPGPFRRRTHTKVAVIYYSDVGGSPGAALPSSAGGERDGTYVLLESARAAGTAVTPYVAEAVPIEGTGITAMPLPGDKWETIVEFGGMSRLRVTAAQKDPPNDALGAVSYRIWVDVEDVP